MAIFNKSNDKKKPSSNATTVIAHGTKIEGELQIECNLHIDGQFNGTIKAKKNVTIGKTGIAKGDLFTKKLILSGNFIGNVDADTIYILKDGKLCGQVIKSELIIEKGGLFEGESKIKDTLKLTNKKPLKIDSKKSEQEETPKQNPIKDKSS